MQKTVMVIGGGTMGAGIAFVAAQSGCDVTVIEPAQALHERIYAQISKNAERAGSAQIAARVRVVTDFEAESTSDFGLAIEAAPENIEIKRRIFGELEKLVSPQTLLATNTSSLSVAEIFRHIKKRERTFGLHFFNPPPLMKLVEIVRSSETSDDTIAQATAYVDNFGKTGVVTADTPGFIVNRVARPFYLEAMRALERGEASAEAIDAAARAAGFRMGPFELMDLIGLDINLATSESIYERTGLARLRPVEIQRVLVAKGHLGRKTGEGFYRYDESGGALPMERAGAENAAGAHAVETMIARILEEARALVDEDAASLENVNLAMKYGVNYPESVRL